MSSSENTVLNSPQILLNRIKERGPISKQELKRTTGLSWAAVSTSVNELVDAGYVVPISKKESQGPGRKADEYDINPDNNYFIGIDFNDKGMLCVVTDLKGRVIRQKEREFSIKEKNHILEQLYENVDTFFEEFPDKRIWGIGIGAQGVVDVFEGVSVYIAKIKNWNNVPLKQLFEERYQVEVRVLHDPDCLMKSELSLGSLQEKNVTDVIMVKIDFRTGIGMAIMFNGQLCHGFHGKAGEIGFIMVKGKNGEMERLEEQIMRTAILDTYSKVVPEAADITFAEFEKLLMDGDTVGRNIYKQLGENVGYAISSACNFLNPESVILHISSSICPEYFYKIVKDYVLSRTYDGMVEMQLSKLGSNAVAVGSALAVVENAIQNMM